MEGKKEHNEMFTAPSASALTPAKDIHTVGVTLAPSSYRRGLLLLLFLILFLVALHVFSSYRNSEIHHNIIIYIFPFGRAIPDRPAAVRYSTTHRQYPIQYATYV